jgi:LysM repeat protein
MDRACLLLSTVFVLLLMVVPAAADGRINPNDAEYYTVFCANDVVDVYRADGHLLSQFPIGYLLALAADGGSWDAGRGMTVQRNGDTISISGHNGNSAPEYGTKSFLLQECLLRNGNTPAAFEPPVPQAAQPATVVQSCVHEVRLGDTILGIAATYSVDVATLTLLNRVTDPTLIYIGQELSLPGCSGVAAGLTAQTGTWTGPVQGQTYTVRAGDMLAQIAARYDVSLSALAAANNIDNLNLIWEGQRLIIP